MHVFRWKENEMFYLVLLSRCKDLRYPDNLPEFGVVIPFKDEHLSVLLRTVYSILYNTPDHLVKEIVLVDDGSINSMYIS